MFESLDFSEAFRHTSISVKIFENHSLGQNFRKIAIFIKIGENFQIFGKSRFYPKHLDFGANNPTISILVKLIEKSWLKWKF